MSFNGIELMDSVLICLVVSDIVILSFGMNSFKTFEIPNTFSTSVQYLDVLYIPSIFYNPHTNDQQLLDVSTRFKTNVKIFYKQFFFLKIHINNIQTK